ncbi:uncharacterized protein TNCV_3754281 [Trichonephila clavipes]|nr:uncharacterized protein TNCV_3754281 [Trichonephila clavipes]
MTWMYVFFILTAYGNSQLYTSNVRTPPSATLQHYQTCSFRAGVSNTRAACGPTVQIPGHLSTLDLISERLISLRIPCDVGTSQPFMQNYAIETCPRSIWNIRFFSNVRLEKLNTVVKKDTSAIGNYILVDFNQVNNLLRSAKCQYCEKQTLKLELGAKLGFSYNLKLLCSNCDENKTVVNTSLKSVQTSHDVNLRITQAFSHIGKGYSAIEKFCMVMNIDPFPSTTYGKCARRLDNAYTLASENIFAEIHREIKNVYENGAEITDLSVSFDGTWLTRGHTSLIGVGFVIDMLTGYVVDFEVMSKVCRHCSVAKNKLGQSSAEFSIWYEGHKSECDINHLGSSTSMEMEAALTLWKRSTSLGFRYITVLSDGDCKTFNYLCEKKCMDLTL